MTSRLDNVIGTVKVSDLGDWVREVYRIIADKGDTESMRLFRNLTVRSVLFLYLNYSDPDYAASTVMDTNYMDIDENIGDIVAIYSENGEEYYALLRNLHTVALDGSSDIDVDNIVKNQNVGAIYLDADVALGDYKDNGGTTFLRDLPTMQGFVSDNDYDHPYTSSIEYWRYA